MNNIIEPNWKDEILDGEAKYRKRKDGNIIDDDFSIELKTPVIQQQTPLNKTNLETPLGEIRIFSNPRNDDKYLLCDGSRIYIEDYPELSKIIPRKYTYDTLQLDTTYAGVSQISYFPKKSLYIMVRTGSSSTGDFVIFTSEDGENWTLRYTSDNTDYSYTPTISYIEELDRFVGVSYYRIISSSDGYNWTLGKSLTYTGDYMFRQPTYSPLLGKALITQYDTDSSYSTTLYGTTDFINFETICTKSGNATETFFTKVIEANGKLYASGGDDLAPYILFCSTDNGKTFTKSNPILKFDTNDSVKYGEYWYSSYRTSATSGSTRYICRTKDFETIEVLGGSASDAILGVINGYLFYRSNGVLIRRDLDDNVATFDNVDTLNYFSIRKEYVKIMEKELYCSKDLNTWEKYDNMPTNGVITALFICPTGKTFARPSASANYVFTHDEKQINLPTIDIGYAYIKAYLNESEG